MPRSRDLGGFGTEIARDRAISKLRSVASLSFETLRSVLRSQNCDLRSVNCDPDRAICDCDLCAICATLRLSVSRSRDLLRSAICDLRSRDLEIARSADRAISCDLRSAAVLRKIMWSLSVWSAICCDLYAICCDLNWSLFRRPNAFPI